MFFSLIQFEASPTGAFYCFFFMLPWHLSYSESTLWNLWLKRKKKSYIRPQWCVVATGHTTMFWTCVIWWIMLTLSVLYLIYLQFYWTIGNRKDCRYSGCSWWVWMPVVPEYDAKRVPHLFPGRSFMPFSSLMIHLPIIKHASLSCLIYSNKA